MLKVKTDRCTYRKSKMIWYLRKPWTFHTLIILTSVKYTFVKSSLRNYHFYVYIAKKVLCNKLKVTYIWSNTQGKKRLEDIPTRRRKPVTCQYDWVHRKVHYSENIFIIQENRFAHTANSLQCLLQNWCWKTKNITQIQITAFMFGKGTFKGIVHRCYEWKSFHNNCINDNQHGFLKVRYV